MELKKIVEILEEIAPPELAEDFDEGRIGLILNLENDVKKIAVALDANTYVLGKAAEIGADLLITHHTLIFRPVNIISKPLLGFQDYVLDYHEQCFRCRVCTALQHICRPVSKKQRSSETSF